MMNHQVAKIFGALILVLGAMSVFYSFKYVLPFWTHDEAGVLQALWDQDIESLAKSNRLPKEWLQIEKVDLIASGEESKTWLKQVKPLIPQRAGGKYHLEVLVDRWSDEKGVGALIQYNLEDKESRETVWELARTFSLTQNKIVSEGLSKGQIEGALEKSKKDDPALADRKIETH